MKKELNSPEDFAILRSLFIQDVEKELKKNNKKKQTPKRQRYNILLNGLLKQLKNFEIKNQDLKINKIAFEKIKRDEYLAHIKWYFIAGLIIFMILAISIILIGIYLK
ncbi:hypothetical protein [Mycoplasmopsis canis]|uniref:hypothetical protein n=1 Tax=Mycoplasmopsis canis TaxID=29555 RepID=UPI00025ADA23|nr:hypothetical protein [Mycoplasmopsis canis]EIE40654.1 hypothetical protein MCANUF33_00838 [Mycoplasmopsis canis UF33]